MTSPLPAAREPALLVAFVALADTLIDDYDVVDLLHRLVETCTQLIPADTAGIVLADGRGVLQVMAYTTDTTRRLELLQLQAQEGPCLDCVHTGHLLSAPDLTETLDQWPQFTPRAIQEGFCAVHALPMRLRTQIIGGLNLFSTQPGPLPPEDLRVGQALADVAAIGVLHERALRRSKIRTEQLQAALDNRVIIVVKRGANPGGCGWRWPTDPHSARRSASWTPSTPTPAAAGYDLADHRGAKRVWFELDQ